MTQEQIVTQIAASAGISQEQAQNAFLATINFVKTKLPDSVSSQLGGLMEGRDFDFNTVIKDKLTDLKEDAGEKLENLKDGAKEKFDDLKEGAKGIIDKIF